MRRISYVSSPCRWEEMSEESLKDWPKESKLSEIQSRRNLERTSVWMKNTVTFTLAQLTLVLA